MARDPGYYFREPSDPPARFDGVTAKILGVHGELVSLEGQLRLFRGEHPETGERLPGLANVKDRRGAIDITFNCPKPVSIAEQVVEDERIAAVRLDAEFKAMKEVERQACIRVGSGKDRRRESGNILWAGFGHQSSREDDPHSHRHYLVYNAAWSGESKRGFKAVELRYLDRARIDDVYHAELAKGMRKLGYEANWDRKSREFALHGFPKDVQMEFSQRHNAIHETGKAMEAKIGKPMSAKAKGKLSLYNRPEKEHVSIDVRRRGWLSRLSKSQLAGLHGFVDSAKLRVAMGKWQSGLKRYASKLRNLVHEAPERDRDHGVGR